MSHFKAGKRRQEEVTRLAGVGAGFTPGSPPGPTRSAPGERLRLLPSDLSYLSGRREFQWTTNDTGWTCVGPLIFGFYFFHKQRFLFVGFTFTYSAKRWPQTLFTFPPAIPTWGRDIPFGPVGV